MELPFNNTTGCTVPTYQFFVFFFIFLKFFKALRFKLNSFTHWPSIPPPFYVRVSPLPSLSVFQVDAPIPGKAHPRLFTEACNWHIKTKYIKPALVKSTIHSYRGATLQDLMKLFYNCNSRLLRSHMILKKNRPYNHWLKSQVRDNISCVFLPRTVGANSVHLRHETKSPLQLRSHYQNPPPPPTLKNKNVPILRSQNTQITRTPLKTGSEQSVQLLFIRQWNFDPFQMDQSKTLHSST